MYNMAAANFLCDQSCGDLYDAYLRLCNVSGNGDGNRLAFNHVDVWLPLVGYTVDGMIELIDKAAENLILPEFIYNIDWKLLKQQNDALTLMINSMGVDEDDYKALVGIQSLLDSVKDFAVDKLGFPEETVFPDME